MLLGERPAGLSPGGLPLREEIYVSFESSHGIFYTGLNFGKTLLVVQGMSNLFADVKEGDFLEVHCPSTGGTTVREVFTVTDTELHVGASKYDRATGKQLESEGDVFCRFQVRRLPS